MDAATIQARVNRGLGIGARFVGQPMDRRRLAAPMAPVSDSASLGMVPVYLDPDPEFRGKRPSGYGKPQWYALADRTGWAVGDYLIGPQGKFFVAALQSLLPTMVIECNAVLAVSRPTGGDLADEDRYGGAPSSGAETPVLAGWPASVLRAGRTVAGRADLPGDVPDGGFEALLPAYPGADLRTSDRVLADDGRRFVVSSAELSDLGWRLMLVLSVT